MNDHLRGPLRVIQVSVATGAGGDIAASLRPPVGEMWDLYIARGAHNGAAGLTCTWYFQDTIGPVLLLCGSGISQPRSFYTDVGGFGDSLRLHYNSYLTFQVTGIAGGLVVGISAVYERITGAAIQGA